MIETVVDDGDFPNTPPYVAEQANFATLNLLPEKSRCKYEVQYSKFITWCQEKSVTNYTESVLLAYFAEKSTSFRASTLWSIFSMLKATLQVKNDIDIGQYKRLIAFLKRKSVGYKAKKSKILERNHIDKFVREAPNEQFLMMKVS